MDPSESNKTSHEPIQTVLITGVSRGLGAALADGMIARGHTVIGCSRSRGAIKQRCEKWSAPNRADIVDVADDSSIRKWSEDILSNCGAPDLLINNAAIINPNAPLWEVSAEEFSKIIDINIKGVANVIRHFLPAMIERGSGVVVNFSSGWGRGTSPEVAPYCATKWAIEGMTNALAQELPPGLAAVTLNPGVINTAMLQSCFGDSAASYRSAQEWAEQAVPFLLGLRAKDNGQSLTAPG